MPVSRSPLRLLLLLAIGAPAEAWSAFHGRPAMRARGEPAVTGLSHYSTPLLRQRTHELLMAEKPSVPSVSKAALVDAIALKAGVSKKTAAVSRATREWPLLPSHTVVVVVVVVGWRDTGLVVRRLREACARLPGSPTVGACGPMHVAHGCLHPPIPCRQLVLGATLDVIVDSVCDNNKVSLVGFGTFSAKERPEREVRSRQRRCTAPCPSASARVLAACAFAPLCVSLIASSCPRLSSHCSLTRVTLPTLARVPHGRRAIRRRGKR